MRMATSMAMTDPLHAFFHHHGRQGWPMPLVATRYTVTIRAGLAAVEAVRSFRNDEAQSIEATLTFPVPVAAVVHGLEARIGERRLTGIARPRNAARETYEAAIDDGRTAVLHEEVLKGIHILSVGHVPPGQTIDVTLRFVLPLACIGGRATLRIPLTVGQVYGRSPLNEADDLLVEGGAGMAGLEVACTDGSVSLAGATLVDGRATVPLNAPIDLAVTGWAPRELVGRNAPGLPVGLRIEPAPAGTERLDIAVLVDRSGSMSQPVGRDGLTTKHGAVREALLRAARLLQPEDVVELWQFDDRVQAVGRSDGRQPWGLAQLARRLGQPRGGTAIGDALAGVLAGAQTRDILLVTDGQSHDLDVARIAAAGRRVSAVLVGSASLEAHVGHLAALTGGQLFVAADAEVEAAVAAALTALRSAWQPPRLPAAPGEPIVLERAGMRLTLRLESSGTPPADADPAVAAMVAGLLLGTLADGTAVTVACAEGLVTHLTSLVLVDDAGERQDGVPAMRKVPLPEARRHHFEAPADCLQQPGRVSYFMAPSTSDQDSCASMDMDDLLSARVPAPDGSTLPWDTAPDRLAAGDLDSLDPATATRIRAIAADGRVIALAAELGLEPVVLVVGLFALVQRDGSRTARRIARRLLGKEPGIACWLLAGDLCRA